MLEKFLDKYYPKTEKYQGLRDMVAFPRVTIKLFVLVNKSKLKKSQKEEIFKLVNDITMVASDGGREMERSLIEDVDGLLNKKLMEDFLGRG